MDLFNNNQNIQENNTIEVNTDNENNLTPKQQVNDAMEELKKIIRKVKEYHKKQGNMNVRELTDYIAIKNVILNKTGILCTDELLVKTEDEIFEELINAYNRKIKEKELREKELNESIDMVKKAEEEIKDELSKKEIRKELKVIEEGTKKMSKDVADYLEAGVDDKYRNKIRKQIIEKDKVIVNIKRGKVFKIETNAVMNRITIEIPQDIEINIEQTMLLQLYDEEFGGKRKQKVDETPSQYINKDLLDGIQISEEDKENVNILKDEKKAIEDNIQGTKNEEIVKEEKETKIQSSNKPQENKEERKKMSKEERQKIKNKTEMVRRVSDNLEDLDGEIVKELFEEFKDYYKVRDLLKKVYKKSYGEIGRFIVKKFREMGLEERELVELGFKENSKMIKRILYGEEEEIKPSDLDKENNKQSAEDIINNVNNVLGE